MDFHHFPQFDPDDGNPGDTLIWYPTKHLRIADKDSYHPPLYYMPKQDVCQTCPGMLKCVLILSMLTQWPGGAHY